MEYQESGRTIVPPDATPRVFLQPIAAPSILGMFGLAGASFVIAAHMAGWTGALHPLRFIPFAAIFGGLAQFLASMWAYKARDGMATALHGSWGAFWMSYGVLAFFFSRGPATLTSAVFPELGYWFIVLAAITWACAIAAVAENKAMVTVITFLAAAATLSAIGLLAMIDGLLIIAGYLFLIAAIAAWYTASALMMNESHGREVWSLGRNTRTHQAPSMTVVMGEPGVIRGQ